MVDSAGSSSPKGLKPIKTGHLSDSDYGSGFIDLDYAISPTYSSHKELPRSPIKDKNEKFQVVVLDELLPISGIACVNHLGIMTYNNTQDFALLYSYDSIPIRLESNMQTYVADNESRYLTINSNIASYLAQNDVDELVQVSIGPQSNFFAIARPDKSLSKKRSLSHSLVCLKMHEPTEDWLVENLSVKGIHPVIHPDALDDVVPDVLYRFPNIKWKEEALSEGMIPISTFVTGYKKFYGSYMSTNHVRYQKEMYLTKRQDFSMIMPERKMDTLEYSEVKNPNFIVNPQMSYASAILKQNKQRCMYDCSFSLLNKSKQDLFAGTLNFHFIKGKHLVQSDIKFQVWDSGCMSVYHLEKCHEHTNGTECCTVLHFQKIPKSY